MGALADYYASMAAENYSKVGLNQAQAQLTGNNAVEVAPNAATDRALREAQTVAASAGAKASLGSAAEANARAASIPLTTAANVAGTNADALLRQAQAGAIPSEVGLRGAQADDLLSQARLRAAQGGVLDRQNDDLIIPGFGLGGVQGKAKGGKIVQPGKGKLTKPGPSDTVPAMLTPGEMVMNKGAVAHYGTDVLAKMNKMGMLRQAAHHELVGHLKKMKGSKAKKAAKKKAA